MDKQTIEAIRQWVAEGNALNEIVMHTVTWAEYEAVKQRSNAFFEKRTAHAHEWIAALLAEHDDNEASHARTRDVFGGTAMNTKSDARKLVDAAIKPKAEWWKASGYDTFVDVAASLLLKGWQRDDITTLLSELYAAVRAEYGD